MSKAIELAVVGHTNAGKTSLLRTLTRRIDFGEVSDRPGTTRDVKKLPLTMNGNEVIYFLDTPGLEDAPSLLEHFEGMDASYSCAQKISAFILGPLAKGDFEQEAKVLRCMRDVDAALLVIDTREIPLPKFSDEIEILRMCAKPILPVLNFVDHPNSKEAAWLELCAIHGVHGRVRFETVAPMHDAENNLYRDLGGLLPDRREKLQALTEFLAAERVDRHESSLRLVGELVLSLAACREMIDSKIFSDVTARSKSIQSFQDEITLRSRQGLKSMLELHGFDTNSAEAALLPKLTDRWGADLFNPDTLKQAGKRMGIGVIAGSAAGLAADAALAGLSLGAGLSAGAALGGVLSQGRLGSKLLNKLRGRHELSLNDGALLLLVRQHLSMLIALEKRGHADQLVLQSPRLITIPEKEEDEFLDVVKPARAYPEWAFAQELNAKLRKKRDLQNEILGRLFKRLLNVSKH